MIIKLIILRNKDDTYSLYHLFRKFDISASRKFGGLRSLFCNSAIAIDLVVFVDYSYSAISLSNLSKRNIAARIRVQVPHRIPKCCVLCKACYYYYGRSNIGYGFYMLSSDFYYNYAITLNSIVFIYFLF